MIDARKSLKLALAVAVIGVSAASLAGCSAGDAGISLNGKIFDAVGLGGGGGPQSEAKLAERAPLVPPPRADRLPPPEQTSATGEHLAWPTDPEKTKAQKLSAEEQKLRKDCEDPMIGRPDAEKAAKQAKCSTVLGDLFGSILPGKKAEAPAEPLREGDPGAPKASAASAQSWQTNTQVKR